MDENSPFFIYDPKSRGSLYFKYAMERPISDDDISEVLRNDKLSHNDPRMLPILIAAHQGKLNKNRGRPNKKETARYKAMMLLVSDDINTRAAEIKRERKKQTAIEKRSLPTPKVQAAEEIAHQQKMSISGPALLTAISSFNKDQIFGDGKDRKK